MWLRKKHSNFENCSACIFLAITRVFAKLYFIFILNIGYSFFQIKWFQKDPQITFGVMGSLLWQRKKFLKWKHLNARAFCTITLGFGQLHQHILLLFWGCDGPLSKSGTSIRIYVLCQNIWFFNGVTQKNTQPFKIKVFAYFVQYLWYFLWYNITFCFVF